jgi:hypothetical protein
MAFIFIGILLFYGGTNVYIGKRLFGWLAMLFPSLSGVVFAVLFTLIASSLFLGFLPLPLGVRGVMRWVASYWMGLYVYIMIFFLIADMVVLIGRLPSGARFYTVPGAVLLSVGIICYGVVNANKIITVTYDIPMDRMAGEMTVVLLGDLHLGEPNNDRRLERTVQGINALNPDIVCLAGDIFTGDYRSLRDPEGMIGLMRSIEAAYGVYAVLGNHDAGDTFPEMMDFLERSGVTVLKDETAVVDGRLILLGRLDASPIGGFGGLRRAEEVSLPALDLPVVVMEHNPAHIGEYDGIAGLILTGHTHRGQIFPGGLFTKALFAADYGYYQKDAGSPHVIVTQGAGTWMLPMRIGTRNEIVGITLRSG